MNTLTNAKPSAIVTEFGFTTFYFDVKPKGMYRLPAYSEFNLVYSASDSQGWESRKCAHGSNWPDNRIRERRR